VFYNATAVFDDDVLIAVT